VKSILQELQCEIGLITDQMDRVSRHGQLICQRTRDEHEQQLVRTTLSNLTDQLQQVRSWLEEKKLQVWPDPILSLRIPIPTFHPIRPEFLFSFFSILVFLFAAFHILKVGDSIDSWQRFLQLHSLVISWVDEKKCFLTEPLHLTSLVQARQKSQDYNVRINFYG
jgi:nesprin-1